MILNSDIFGCKVFPTDENHYGKISNEYNEYSKIILENLQK